MAFIKRIKEKREEKIRREDEIRKEKLKIREERQNKINTNVIDSMTSKPCAIRANFGNCTTECVHFYKGYVSTTPNFSGDDFWVHHDRPKCLLWK